MTLKMRIHYRYNHVLHSMSESQILEYFEDNDLDDTYDNRSCLSAHFKCFNFLHHLYSLNQRLPLYLNPSNPTPYTPITPPRTLSQPFEDIDRLWLDLVVDVGKVFAYVPNSTRHAAPIKSRPYYLYDLAKKHAAINSYGMQQLNITQLQQELELIKQNGYVFHNEVWIKQGDILYPHTLSSALNLLRFALVPNNADYGASISTNIIRWTAGIFNEIPQLNI